MDNQSDKINLFDSGEEEDDHDDFKIRPQFHGPHGQQLLEISSQLSKRFKLDERFIEDFAPEILEEANSEITEERNVEREQNIRILENILGHEVCPKTSDKKFPKKRQIRFDPDDDDASKYVKNSDISCEKPKKKKKKIVKEKVEQNVPISTERYIEVCDNFKEILNTATPFSFSQKFNCDVEELGDSQSTYEEPFNAIEEIKTHDCNKKDETKMSIQSQKYSTKHKIPESKDSTFHFFVKEGDFRLKEGSMFKRTRPLDEIRVEWQKRAEIAMEICRRKKRSSQRSYSSNRVQSRQIKNTIRKKNFK